MKTHTFARSILAFVLFFAISGLAAAQRPPEAPADLSPAEADSEMLTTYDLSGMSMQWWNDLAKDVDVKLKGSDAEKQEAMRKVIFLATYYPDMANFKPSTTELYNIWRFNRNEQYRIMALASLFATGDESAMALLAQRGNFATYAPWDPSPLVQRLTAAAVARYYGVPGVEVGPLQPLGVE